MREKLQFLFWFNRDNRQLISREESQISIDLKFEVEKNAHDKHIGEVSKKQAAMWNIIKANNVQSSKIYASILNANDFLPRFLKP